LFSCTGIIVGIIKDFYLADQKVSKIKMLGMHKMFNSAAVAQTVRKFSTKSHVPPKKVHGTIGRYAGATYTAASKVL
jgi:hypothetical protein